MNRAIFALALLLSFSLHATLLLFEGWEKKERVTSKVAPMQVELLLVQREKSAPKLLEVQKPKEEPKEEEVLPQKQKKELKRVVKKKPAPKKVIKPQEVVKKAAPPPKEESLVAKQIPVEKPTKIVSNEPTFDEIEAEKLRFLESVRFLLDKNKRYPKSARRRGVEGDIEVRFLIERSGVISEIRVEGERLLKKATQESLLSLGKLELPKHSAKYLPLQVTTTLQFRLN